MRRGTMAKDLTDTDENVLVKLIIQHSEYVLNFHNLITYKCTLKN